MATNGPFDTREAAAVLGFVPAPRNSEGHKPPRFKVEFLEDIKFDHSGEWLIKGLIPARGVGAIFGDKHTFKSFIAYYAAHCLASGIDFAGRKTKQTNVIYIAAEGAGGMAKRKLGYTQPPPKTFAMVRSAPNLGRDPGDAPDLIAAVEAAAIKPGAIFIDTVNAALGGADENGEGMTAFVSNCRALSDRFKSVVVVVHHVGHGTDNKKRMRGRSDLPAACDFQIRCDREEGALTAKLTLATARNSEDGIVFAARLERAVVGQDDDGDIVTTLIVADIASVGGEVKPPKESKPKVGKSNELLYDIIDRVVDVAGEEIRPFPGGPTVRAADAELIRDRYYEALGQKKNDDAKRRDHAAQAGRPDRRPVCNRP